MTEKKFLIPSQCSLKIGTLMTWYTEPV